MANVASATRPGLRQRLLKIQPGEGRRVGLMIVYSTAGMGGVVTIGFATGNALFLSGIPPTAVPYALILPSIVTVPTLLLYNWVASRVRLDYLVIGATAVMLAGIGVLRALLDSPYSRNSAVLAGLYIWVTIMTTLITTQFWTFAGQIFNPREAKRLFALIALGGTVANVVAGAILQSIVAWIGVKNLLYVMGLGLLTCLFCAWVLGRLEPGARAVGRSGAGVPGGRGGGSVWQDLQILRRSPLLLSITVLVILVTLLVNIPAYQFGLALQQAYSTDSRQMVGILGVISFWSGLAALFMQAYVSDRVMGRFGVIPALLFLPLAAAGSAVALMLTGGAFWAAVWAQTNNRTVRRTITDAALNVLYLPVPGEVRGRAKVVTEGISAVAVILLGVLMLVLQNVPSWTFVQWSLPTLALAVIWLLVLARVRKQYLQALATNVHRHRLLAEEATLDVADPQTLPLLTTALQQDDPQQVLSALELIATAPQLDWSTYVAPLLGHRSPAVQRQALQCLGDIHSTRYLDSIRGLLASPDEGVCAAAIETLCALTGLGGVRQVLPFLHDPRPRVHGAVILGLLKYGGAAGIQTALGPLAALFASPQPALRQAGAYVVGAIGLPRYHHLLQPLFADPQLDVQISAIRAAGELRAPALIPALAKKLGSRPTLMPAVTSLVRYGPGIEVILGEMLDNPATPIETRIEIPATLWRIGTPAAAAILLDHLQQPNEAIRNAIYLALARMHAGEDAVVDAAAVRAALDAEIRAAYAWYLIQANLGGAGGDSLLGDAILTRRGRALDRIFWLLSILYPSQALEPVRQALEEPGGNRRAQAIELLDTLLGREVKELLLPLLEGSPAAVVEIARRRLLLLDKTGVDRLQELVTNPDPWLPACALFTIATLGMTPLTEVVLEARSADDSLIREAAETAYQRLLPAGAGVPARPGQNGTGPAAAPGPTLSTMERVAFLRGVDFFKAVPGETLVRVAQIAQEVAFAPGETFIQQGDLGASLYIIVDGEVSVIIPGLGQVAYYKAKSAIGEMALITRNPRTADCRAVTRVLALKIEHDDFWDVLNSEPILAQGVIQMLAGRIDAANQNLRIHKAGGLGGEIPPRALGAGRALPAGAEGGSAILSTIGRVAVLRSMSLFAAVPGRVLIQLAHITQEVAFSADEPLIQQGALGEQIYLLVEGAVEIVLDGFGPVAHFAAPAIVGEMAAITRHARTTTCRATTDGLALILEADVFWELLEDQPAFASGMIHLLAERLDAAVATLRRQAAAAGPAR
ncbi:MAG TPA: Npt1/Npt2 family nucleotide transporter [Chloroflexia bacterium]|nr:Npt1/Npt2 family nucleotide transporter [Chloroflexia bacterium]